MSTRPTAEWTMVRVTAPNLSLLTAIDSALPPLDPSRPTQDSAEVVLVREVAERYGLDSLRGATVYASGEPRAMCSGALFRARVARIVYAAASADIIAALGGPELPTRCADVLSAATPPVLIEGPLLREPAVAVLQATASAGTKR